MRGEDHSELKPKILRKETPPRAWGRRKPPLEISPLLRNTPTCVGKTSPTGMSQKISRKHPHVRGEDLPGHTHMTEEEETPPRAWGRRRTARDSPVQDRNTPTCVGKTGYRGLSSTKNEKHPHVRGEDSVASRRVSEHPETPPRAWGRQQFIGGLLCSGGNTPTCVGKTLRDYSLFLLSRQNNIETSSFSDTSCSPDNSMSWRFGSPMP